MNDRPFERSLPMLLNRTLDAVLPAYRSLFAQHGLTEQQWRVLRALWENSALSNAALAERTLLPASSLVGVLDRLERKGLVTRLRSVEDRRIVFVKSTAEGRALERQIAPALQDVQEKLIARLSAQEWDQLESLLNKASGATEQNEREVLQHGRI